MVLESRAVLVIPGSVPDNISTFWSVPISMFWCVPQIIYQESGGVVSKSGPYKSCDWATCERSCDNVGQGHK